MRGLYYHFVGVVEDIIVLLREHPAMPFSFLILAYIGFSLLVDDYLLSCFTPNTVREILGLPFLLLLGVFGIVLVRYKELPVFIVPITGLAAIIIGIFLILGGFGLFIVGIVNMILR